jgi:hypothetical protein
MIATLSLTGCDEFSSHARAAQEVLDGTTLPSDFSPAGTSYPGMTQDTPVQKFTAPPGTGLVPSAVHVPDAFERDLTIENQLREGSQPRARGELVGFWVGPSPVGSRTCNIRITIGDASDGDVRADVQVACILD